MDGCYSFWQAANFPLIDGEMAREVRFPWGARKGLYLDSDVVLITLTQ